MVVIGTPLPSVSSNAAFCLLPAHGPGTVSPLLLPRPWLTPPRSLFVHLAAGRTRILMVILDSSRSSSVGVGSVGLSVYPGRHGEQRRRQLPSDGRLQDQAAMCEVPLSGPILVLRRHGHEPAVVVLVGPDEEPGVGAGRGDLQLPGDPVLFGGLSSGPGTGLTLAFEAFSLAVEILRRGGALNGILCRSSRPGQAWLASWWPRRSISSYRASIASSSSRAPSSFAFLTAIFLLTLERIGSGRSARSSPKD